MDKIGAQWHECHKTGTVAVSYTHLDVYKRQVLQQPAAYGKAVQPHAQGFIFFQHNGDAPLSARYLFSIHGADGRRNILLAKSR